MTVLPISTRISVVNPIRTRPLMYEMSLRVQILYPLLKNRKTIKEYLPLHTHKPLDIKQTVLLNAFLFLS